MEIENLNKEIIDTLSTKSVWKRDVFELAKVQFNALKVILQEEVAFWSQEVAKVDDRLEISYSETGAYYAQITIAGDTLIFAMHTNIFRFPDGSVHWRSSYFKDNPNRAFCGIFSVYNFLADSFRFNRHQDMGYLLARVFLNHENHFVMEGKRNLHALYTDFHQYEFTPETMKHIVRAIVCNSLQFDLYVPPYNEVQVISVQDAIELKDAISLKTGKRLGFQFEADMDLE